MNSPLKVVHLSNNDIRGGASRAGYGIKNALSIINPDTLFLTQRKFSEDEKVISLSDTIIEKQFTNARMLLDLLAIKLLTQTKNGRFSFAFIGKDVSGIKEVMEADILHLHWINEGFLSLRNLRALSKLNKPIFWTFHDMWAFTGGCHYSSGCKGYEFQCGMCPYLKHPDQNDFSRKLWKKKSELYNKLNVHIVTPSNWLKECVNKSSLFKNNDVEVIPYAIDTDLYRPLNKKECRKVFGLPGDKVLLLFGTMNTGEIRKGYPLLINALSKLHSEWPELKEKIEILVVGSTSEKTSQSIPYKMYFTGRIYSEEKLVASYNAADFFIAPSIEDNYPNTVMESLACGVPVLAFNIGGMPDMILSGKNGLLIDEISSQTLSSGIKWMVDNANSADLSNASRQKILNDNLPVIIGNKYLELYKKFVNSKLV